MMEKTEFEHLAPQLRDKALKTCLAMGIDTMTADDVAQDVMLKLWTMKEELSRYRSLQAVVCTMAKHIVIDGKRQKTTDQLTDDMLVMSQLPSPHERLEVLEDDQWLRKRLDALPSKQHAVLRLRQVEHKSYEEIAKLAGIEVTSARTLVARARKALLEEFKQKTNNEQRTTTY